MIERFFQRKDAEERGEIAKKKKAVTLRTSNTIPLETCPAEGIEQEKTEETETSLFTLVKVFWTPVPAGLSPVRGYPERVFDDKS